MIPEPDKALLQLAQKLATTVVPELDSAYSATNVAMISMLLVALGQKIETAVSDRVEDGQALRTLFEGASEAPDHASLKAFIASQPNTLSITDVSTWLDEGLQRLIDLHGWAEDNDAALDRQIWDFLRDHGERFKIDL